MEISGISASAASLSDGAPHAFAVLKKALDVQAQTAAALISTLPPPAQPGSSPPTSARTSTSPSNPAGADESPPPARPPPLGARHVSRAPFPDISSVRLSRRPIIIERRFMI